MEIAEDYSPRNHCKCSWLPMENTSALVWWVQCRNSRASWKKKHSCYKYLLKKPDHDAIQATYKNACSVLKAKLHYEKWLVDGTCKEETGFCLCEQHVLFLWDTEINLLHCPSYQIQAPLHSADDTTLLTDMETIMKCWTEHTASLSVTSA